MLLLKDKQRYHSEINPVIIINLKMGRTIFELSIHHNLMSQLLLATRILVVVVNYLLYDPVKVVRVSFPFS